MSEPDRPDGGTATREAGRPATTRPSGFAARLFVALLVFWAVLPVLLDGRFAQDAVPFVVAGELLGESPRSVYATDATDLYDLPDAFAERACEVTPPGSDCGLNVAFVSPPHALPPLVALSALGPDIGILVLRLVASLSLAGGMWALWARLAPRTPAAPAVLAATALILTPFVMLAVVLGQTSPLLFLSACLGVGSARRGQLVAAALALLWVATVSLKLFPLALLVLLLWQRQWRLLAWAAVSAIALTTLAALVVPAAVFGDFVDATRTFASFADENRYNSALPAVLHAFDVQGAAVDAVGVALGLIVVGTIGWRLRRADEDVQWSWAWVAVLLFVPLVWWHYLWLAIPAVVLALVSRERIDRRPLLALPVLAFVLTALTLVNGDAAIVSLLQWVVLVAVVVATGWWAAPTPVAPSSPTVTTA